jgi:hypothetical protein
LNANVEQALKKLISKPLLASARELEAVLKDAGMSMQLLGRANQKAAMDAVAVSDRGITERLANAFDASLTAARINAGVSSTRALTPRECARRFVCTDDSCDWNPQSELTSMDMPSLQFWEENADEKLRFRKYNPKDGLATVLVSDQGTGIDKQEMVQTILALNSDSKLKVWEAIGQFGHGGSSALSFCESALIITQPRSPTTPNEAYWTLVISEPEDEESKQGLVRRWFSDSNGLPLELSITDFPELQGMFPGTSIWHFGYHRGGWINPIAGAGQNTPWGRMGRMFFSYPLPFKVKGEFASKAKEGEIGREERPIKGAFFRLLERWKRKQKDDTENLVYYSAEKSQTLIVDGDSFGTFSAFVFVFEKKDSVKSYVDARHPVVLTLNGQNHGEMTSTVIIDANLPEISASCIVEVRLDGLEDEALRNIITNSRDLPKPGDFTRALQESLRDLLDSDEGLRKLEQERQLSKARKSSGDLSDSMSRFLSSIRSDALAASTLGPGDNAPGKGKDGAKTGTRRITEIPPNDPPQILEFLEDIAVIPEGTAINVRFKSDARPPKYSFHHKEHPRLFANFVASTELGNRVRITGKAEISSFGYGHVSLYYPENPMNPVSSQELVGTLTLTLQSADGNLLKAAAEIGIEPKPVERKRKRKSEVKTRIVFVVPDGCNYDELGELLMVENEMLPFSDCSMLSRYSDLLELDPAETSYWGEKNRDENGEDLLDVEINAANKDLCDLLKNRTATERTLLKTKYVRDVVLDCYQHRFQLDELPDSILSLRSEQTENDDRYRAAEVHLNHSKAIQIARAELKQVVASASLAMPVES